MFVAECPTSAAFFPTTVRCAMQPAPMSVPIETYTTLYERSKQSYDAAMYWHKAYEELMIEMKREVGVRDRQIDKLNAELTAAMTSSSQLSAKVTELNASLAAMVAEKKTWMAQAQASQRAAQSAEEERRSSEADRRMGLLLRYAIDGYFKPLEARLGSLSHACQALNASDATRQQTKQSLEQLRADFTDLLRSLTMMMTHQQRQDFVEKRLRDNQRTLNALIASIPSKPPICPDCLNPVDDPQKVTASSSR